MEWPAYCRHTQSEERLEVLESLLSRPSPLSEVLDLFLNPPLWQNDYAHAAGTLYVAQYRPCTRSLTLHWPGKQEYFSTDAFEERTFTVELQTPTDAGQASSV